MPGVERLPEGYQEQQHSRRIMRARVYALAFHMTGDEPLADALTLWAFQRFVGQNPSNERIAITALVYELSAIGIELGTLTLGPEFYNAPGRVRLLRPDLERLVLELPPTERFIYLARCSADYPARTVADWTGLTPQQVEIAAHYAALRLRRLALEEQTKS